MFNAHAAGVSRRFVLSTLSATALAGCASNNLGSTVLNPAQTNDTDGTPEAEGDSAFTLQKATSAPFAHTAAVRHDGGRLQVLTTRNWGVSDEGKNTILEDSTGVADGLSLTDTQSVDAMPDTYAVTSLTLPNGSSFILGHGTFTVDGIEHVLPAGDFSGDALVVGDKLVITASDRDDSNGHPVAGQGYVFVYDTNSLELISETQLQSNYINPTGIVHRSNKDEIAILASGNQYEANAAVLIFDVADLNKPSLPVPSTLEVKREIWLPAGVVAQLSKFSISSDQTYAFITSTSGSGLVLKVNMDSGQENDQDFVSLGTVYQPNSALSGGLLYVVNYYEGTVSILDEATLEKVEFINETTKEKVESLKLPKGFAGHVAAIDGAVYVFGTEEIYQVNIIEDESNG